MSKAKDLISLVEGDKPIGWTGSGKYVYQTFDHPEHAKFGQDEHTDAMLIHSYLFFVKKRKESEVEGKKHEKASADKRGRIFRKFDNKFNPEQGEKLTDVAWR